MNTEYVLGLDIGTQGARAIVTDFSGNIRAEGNASFLRLNIATEELHKEQAPEDWWQAAVVAIRQCMQSLREQGIPAQAVRAMSIDATSGTVLAVDAAGNAKSNGIMYNDARTGAQARQIAGFADGLEGELGYRVNASFGLPKILYLMETMEDSSLRYIHQTDFIVGKLTGEYGVTDYSNALKSCYDLQRQQWPGFLSGLGIDADKLPRVVAPGTAVARVHRQAVEATGLSTETLVVTGATDGYASSLAAGISEVGDWASIIGTTLVLKGIGEKLVVDGEGRIYSHLHPQGWWLIGGASNVGGRCLNDCFDKSRFDELNRSVPSLTPTGLPCYPLFDKGERFPFLRADAEGFMGGFGGDERVQYTALMEGVGYAERLSFEMLEGLGCSVKDDIFTAGGVCKSREWLQIRSDILGKTLKVPRQTDAVMGTALLASLAVRYDTLAQASRGMIQIAQTVHPSEKQGAYEAAYNETKRILRDRGYIA